MLSSSPGSSRASTSRPTWASVCSAKPAKASISRAGRCRCVVGELVPVRDARRPRAPAGVRGRRRRAPSAARGSARAARPSRGRSRRGCARATPAAAGAARGGAEREVGEERLVGVGGCCGRGSSRSPGRRGPRRGGSPRSGRRAGRRGWCPRPAAGELVRLAAQEAVERVEALAGRPVVEGPAAVCSHGGVWCHLPNAPVA